VPVLLYGALAFYLSSLPLDFIGQGPFPQWDKVAHASEYGLFCYLILRALRGSFPKTVPRVIAVAAVLIAVAYGVSDEFHQAFVPSRDSEFTDVLADGGGASLVSAIWFLWSRDAKLSGRPSSGPA
jgi:VanZ family protein